MLQQFLEVGQVGASHGVMGEVRVQPWADSPEFLCQFDTMYVDEAHWPIKVERARVHKNMTIIKFEGLTDIFSANSLKGAVLYIDRKDVKLPEGSFFIADLMGLEARDAQTGEVLGKIADVRTLPSNNVYVIRGGQREILVPAVSAFIAETNIDEGFVRINMIEGL